MRERVPNWSIELVQLANHLCVQPFRWGETDCASVARKALVAMYGKDIVAPYIKVTYTTRLGAARVFSKIGSMADIVIAAGAREVPLHVTRDGDFLIFPKSGGYENMSTQMGGLWVISSPDLNSVFATKIMLTSMTPETKAFRF